MRAPPWGTVAALVAGLLACARGGAPPSRLDTKNELCRFCRMPISDGRLAAQLAAPGEETKFFDDIGCLAGFLKQDKAVSRDAIAYVADHNTAAWVKAAAATFSRCPGLETPMGSHWIAHVGAASREADSVSRGCAPVSAGEIFGSQGPPDGSGR